MIIVNADDWGRSKTETEVAQSCYEAGRISSTTAMVFMEDSERAAARAQECGIDVGMHLNLSQRFSGASVPDNLRRHHERIVRFLTRSKYAQLLYQPLLAKAFDYVYKAQAEEYLRLFGEPPSHVDGHQHMHLCTNMVLGTLIPEGEKIRRGFSFEPGEKGFLNLTYRAVVDRRLARRHRLTDYFFSLERSLKTGTIRRITSAAKKGTVELMTHPVSEAESSYLMSDEWLAELESLELGTFVAI